ncbi:hypothetical protein DENSPDRAFT_885659 [Dentipellis sp. KUC8613]|nr:hypothetical protein DENSPDRAFT_885659 [Dentipellis sp. KUC8613]
MASIESRFDGYGKLMEESTARYEDVRAEVNQLRTIESSCKADQSSMAESKKTVALLTADVQEIRHTFGGRCDGLTSTLAQETEARTKAVSEIRARVDKLQPIEPSYKALKLRVAESEEAASTIKADIQGLFEFQQATDGRFDSFAQKLAQESEVRAKDVAAVRSEMGHSHPAESSKGDLELSVTESEKAISSLKTDVQASRKTMDEKLDGIVQKLQQESEARKKEVADIHVEIAELPCEALKLSVTESEKAVSALKVDIAGVGQVVDARLDSLAQSLAQESEARQREVAAIRSQMKNLHLAQPPNDELKLSVAESEKAIAFLLVDVQRIRKTVDERRDAFEGTQEVDARTDRTSKTLATMGELQRCEALMLRVAELDNVVSAMKVDIQGLSDSRRAADRRSEDLTQKLAQESEACDAEISGIRADIGSLIAAQRCCNGLRSRVADSERVLSALQSNYRRLSDIQQGV